MEIYVKRHYELISSSIFIWADQLSRKREGRLLEREIRGEKFMFGLEAWEIEGLAQELTRV